MSNTSVEMDEFPGEMSSKGKWILLVAFCGFVPLLAQFFFNLWNFDTYQFFPLALAGAVVLFLRGFKEVERPLSPGSFWVPLLLVPPSLIILSFASLVWSPWLGALSFLLMILGVCWGFGGWNFLKAILPGWFVLLTILPPPLKLDERFAMLLQEWAVAGSSRVLDLLMIPHQRTGLVLEIPGIRLLVEEACSGINSILFMTFVCVFYAMWMRRSLLFTLFLYLITILCVLAGNLVRIVSGAWAYRYFQLEILTGWKHEAIGLILTVAYISLIIGAEKVFRNKKGLYRDDAPAAGAQNPSQPLLQSIRPGLAFKSLTVLLVCLGLIQLVRGWDFHIRMEGAKKINTSEYNGTAFFTLPPVIEGWKLVSEAKPASKTAAYEDAVHSHIWRLQKDGLQTIVSLDYPFFGYHDVTVCYRNSGWTVVDSKLLKAAAETLFIPHMEVLMAKPGGTKALLFYITVDEAGNWLENTPTRSGYNEEGKSLQDGNLFERVFLRMRLIPYANENYDTVVNFRIQTLAAAQGGLGSAQKEEVQKLFQNVRTILSAQFVKAAPTPVPTPSPTPINLEPLPATAADPTKRAIEAAREATENDNAVEDATQKAIRAAKQEALEAEKAEADAKKSQKAKSTAPKNQP